MDDRPGAGETLDISDATYDEPAQGTGRRYLNAFRKWFLLRANRRLIVGLLVAATFGLTVLVGAFGPVPVRRFVANGISPGAALVELLKTIVAVVVIVLSINQLVLSPETGSVEEQRERLEDSLALRSRVADVGDVVASPLSPARFLRVVVDAVGDRAADLRDAVPEDNPALREDVETYADWVSDEADRTGDRLADARYGKFEAVPTAMRFDVSGKLRRLRIIRHEHSDVIDDDAREALEAMEDALELFTAARSYLKMVYIRAEYVNFSRSLLFIGFPCLLLTYYAAMAYDPSTFPGATLGLQNRLWFLSGAMTVSLVPMTVLIAYVSRLVTMSQSTLFVGPFIAGADRERVRDPDDERADAPRQ